MRRTKRMLKGIIALFFAVISAENIMADNYFAYNQDGQSGFALMEGPDYIDNMNEVYYIDINANLTLRFNYSVDLEPVNDAVDIYEIDNEGNETLLQTITGEQNGSLITSIPNGRAKIVIHTNSSIGCGSSNYVYWGAMVEFFAVPSQVTSLYGWITTGVNSEYKAEYSTNATAFRFNKPVFVDGSLFVNGSFGASTGALSLQTNNTNRVTILSDGKVGIGTPAPTQGLGVKGNLSLSPSGTTPIESYKGSLMITKPAASGQYINLSRTGASTQWSIGTVYNSSTFAIGQSNATDASFITPPFVIKTDGKVGIGTINPSYALDVKGTIRAAEVKVVDIGQFADYVFDKDYALPKLTEVHRYIQDNGHLPEIPSAAEVKENGMSLVEMQVKLLKKIEELTLYVIEQQKQIEELKRNSEKSFR